MLGCSHVTSEVGVGFGTSRLGLGSGHMTPEVGVRLKPHHIV